MNRAFKIFYGVFITAVVAVALFLAATLIPIPGNFEVRIVQSGSMEPAIKTGGIVIIKPTTLYDKGDVITFGQDNENTIPTTHRIIDMRVESGAFVFLTQGDANDQPDIAEVPEAEVIGKVVFSLPFIGYIIDFARQPLGFAILIGIPAFIVFVEEISRIIREAKKIRRRRHTNHEKRA